MAIKYNRWDLYNTQPFKLYGPITRYTDRRNDDNGDTPATIEDAIAKNDWRAVAGVTYENKNCFTWWNADFLISANMPGSMGGGSGFADYQYKDTILKFDLDWNMWFFKIGPTTDNFGDVYEDFFYFALLEPDKYEKDREGLRLWDAYKQYCPSLEKLRERALKMYPGNPNNEKIRTAFLKKNATFIKTHPYYLTDTETKK